MGNKTAEKDYLYYNTGIVSGVVGVPKKLIGNEDKGYTHLVGRRNEYSWIKTADLHNSYDEALTSKPAEFFYDASTKLANDYIKHVVWDNDAEMSVYDKIQKDFYANPMEYPKKDFGAIRKGIEENFVGTKKEIDLEIERAKNKHTDWHRFLLNEYHRNEGEIRDKFEADLAKEFGVEDNPQRATLFYKAKEMGHSGGYSEVLSVYSNLVELIKMPMQEIDVNSLLPQHYLPIEEPAYRGAGNHSVLELEQIAEQYKELVHQLNIREHQILKTCNAKLVKI